ncbi:hypothetical protein [Sphingomonas sp. PAMC 26617]|uniref:hypothetical protein n=1 Tax=Sphingomonas sp. PAMC 26617 TaxID=1112216 RepID=UPI0002886D99|nr:hypothetical protein [Sphingomonas sp. PAMC 26617]
MLNDPWEQFQRADTGFVGGDAELNSPTPEVSNRSVAPAAPAESASTDPFEKFQRDPGHAQAAEAPDQMAGGFGDQLPDEPLSKLSPKDEAQYNALLHSAGPDELQQFLERRGFASDHAALTAFTHDRDVSLRAGKPVNYGVTYKMPKAVSSGTGSAFVHGGEQGITLGTGDEIHGLISGVNASLHGENFTDAYNTTVDQDRAQLGADQQEHPYATLAGNLAGNLVLPVIGEEAGLTRSMSAVAENSYRAARLEGFTANEARTIASKSIARHMATEGAAYGGAYGAGSANGGPGERLLGGVTGAVEGAAGGALLGLAGQKLAPAIYASRIAKRALPMAEIPEAALVARAAERQGVDILPQDVGGRGIQRATQGAAQSPFGAKVVGDAADRLYTSFSGRVGELAGDAPSPRDAGNIVGDRAAEVANRSVAAADHTSGAVERALAAPSDTTGAGQLIQRGVSRFMDDTAERASALYDQVPVAADQQAQLGSTRRLLNDFTAEWRSNPQLGAIFRNGRLSNFLDALTPNVTRTETGLLDASGAPMTRDVTEGGALSWQDLSEFRTRVGDMLADPNLTEKIAPRQLRALYGSLTSDMEATARDASPEALARWRRANDYYDGRMKRINDTFSMVLGKKGDATPNEAFAAVQGMLKPGSTGNAAAFSRIMRSMPAEDANTVRASIVRDARGGREFDPAAFTKVWGQLSERGKSALLPQLGMRVMMDDAAGQAALEGRSPFAGLSGEQIFAKLDAMAGNRGDSNRFQATMARLSPEEANAVRSTFIHQGGRALPGAQNAEGDAFSISRWLTRWNTMTPESKAVLFGRGELRASMNDLALLAERIKGSEKLAGHSNTGGINEFSKTSMSLWSAAGAAVLGHPIVAVGLAMPAAYQRISAEMLTSPRLLRWLTRIPKEADRAGQLGYLSKLSTIAAREPVIAHNVLDLREFLRTAISRSPEKAAAQNVGDSRQEPPYERDSTNGQ